MHTAFLHSTLDSTAALHLRDYFKQWNHQQKKQKCKKKTLNRKQNTKRTLVYSRRTKTKSQNSCLFQPQLGTYSSCDWNFVPLCTCHEWPWKHSGVTNIFQWVGEFISVESFTEDWLNIYILWKAPYEALNEMGKRVQKRGACISRNTQAWDKWKEYLESTDQLTPTFQIKP